MSRPFERGRLILQPKPKASYCSACDARPPKGRVSAEELWVRMRNRPGNGFVHISK